ncbi:hypothetical protein D050_4781 [Vibrio parahaemolyticus VPCR-2009]|nr:hypothetical protein D050_4781 [Vibrio parahaemolyticus VPCR-2009]
MSYQSISFQPITIIKVSAYLGRFSFTSNIYNYYSLDAAKP